MSVESLQVRVKEVHFPSGDSTQTVLTLSIQDEVTKLEVLFPQSPFSTLIKCSKAISQDTLIQIELFYEDQLWAGAEFRLGDFFGEEFRGECENWVVLSDSQQVEEESEEYTQVKLWMHLSTATHTGKGCPYLTTIERALAETQTCNFHPALTRFKQARVALDLPKKDDRAYIRLQPIGNPDFDLDLELARLSSSHPDHQTDHFKAVIAALEGRVKGLKSIEEELQRLRVEKRKADQSRKDLEETIAGTMEQMRTEGEATTRALLEMERDRQLLAEDLQKANGRVRNLEDELEQTKMTVALQNRSSASLNSDQLE